MCRGGTGKEKHQPEHRLLYLDGLEFQVGLFLWLLMLFYGNLLVLLITENRSHILKKNKKSISFWWAHNTRLEGLAQEMLYLRTECLCTLVLQSKSYWKNTHHNKESSIFPFFGHKAVHICCKLILWKRKEWKIGNEIYKHISTHTQRQYVHLFCLH